MGKIIKSDLLSSSINNMISSLESDITDTDNIIKSLNSFIENTKEKLKGKGYDAARAKAAAYIPILNNRKAIAQNLKSAISSAKSTMLAYMENYDSLDDSKLAETTTKLEQASYDLQQARNAYNDIKAQSSGNDTNYQKYIDSINYYQNLYEELKKLNDKLKHLSQTDISAYSAINSVSQNIANYKSSVSSIKVGNITTEL